MINWKRFAKLEARLFSTITVRLQFAMKHRVFEEIYGLASSLLDFWWNEAFTMSHDDIFFSFVLNKMFPSNHWNALNWKCQNTVRILWNLPKVFEEIANIMKRLRTKINTSSFLEMICWFSTWVMIIFWNIEDAHTSWNYFRKLMLLNVLWMLGRFAF